MDDFCEAVREVLSAHLDGDTSAADLALRHTAGCPSCRLWHARATQLDRVLRITAAPEPADLTEVVLARIPVVARRPDRRRVLRAAMVVVAVAQAAVGLAPLVPATSALTRMSAMAAPHLNHEEAAFNLAFGIVLASLAWSRGRATGALTVLASFVAVLGVTSAVDLADGNVTLLRLATHLPVVVGLLLAIPLTRHPRDDHPATAATTPFPTAPAPAAPVDTAPRAVPSPPRPRPPAAHHPAA